MNAPSVPPFFEIHLANLDRALASLVEFLKEERRTPVVLAGITKAFEYTYELFWTGYQKFAEAHDMQIGGPRNALAAAFILGLISDQQLWLDIKSARNLSSHTYNKGVAESLVKRIEEDFLPCFLRASARLHEVMGT